MQFAAVDETCSFLAIAGNFGLAHYTVLSRKWKVFGNVMQEKDMVVTGTFSRMSTVVLHQSTGAS